MIEAAVFDIEGVLEIVDDGTWPQRWMERWEAVGAASQPDTRGSERRGADGPEAATDTARSNPSESETREMFRLRFGLTKRQADAMMVDMWDCYCGRLDVRLRNFVAGLRPRLATAILSNSADGARREEQRRYDFAGLVDTIIYSHEVGVAKPEPAIYELTAARLNVRPDEIVFLEDSAEAVEGARAAGWHAVQHVDTEQSILAVSALINGAPGGDRLT